MFAQQGQYVTVADKELQISTIGSVGTIISDGVLLGGTPPNDLCAGAVVVDLEAGFPVTRLGDNTGATNDVGFGNAVYEAFTISECLDVTIAYCGTDPAFAGAWLTLFVGCPLTNLVYTAEDNVNPFLCGDGNFSILFPQLAPGTYYYGVQQGTGATGPYELTFSGVPCSATPPVNVDCSGAIVLTPNDTCEPLTVDASGANGAGTTVPTDCDGDSDDGVWFRFVATADEHTISVLPADIYDAVIEVRDGDCSAGSTINCTDVLGQGGEDIAELTGLTVGATYYVRVYDWLAGQAITPSFDICILGPASNCTADAGTLSGGGSLCLVDSSATLTATVNAAPVVPTGYQVVYVLTEGVDLVIIGAGADPEFVVDAAGDYTIHTLVYDTTTLDLGIIEFGVTTGTTVDSLLIQGGGAICGSLDVAGAAFSVAGPVAGTLSSDAHDCFDGAPINLSATPSGNIEVPPGYEVVYVLTEGAGLVILSAGSAPSFTVDGTGNYTIHTLVYDPLTLDLGIIDPGVTTGFDVNALLVQGGGSICASLDVTGAAYNVTLCCDAVSGTLTGGGEVCYEQAPVTLTAVANGDTVVPPGFAVIYVLTEGADLVIVGAGADPEFIVDALGDYTIHTLVYDSTTLDLGIIDFGVTVAGDVNALLVQGGGVICASLDLDGALFNVQLCCDADAGTLTAQPVDCFNGAAVTMTADPNGDVVVPPGFVVLYVLTQGPDQVIVNVSADPEFQVEETGSFTIHTLVYDSTTLDLDIIEIGTTTGAQVDSLLIQGGGTICSSLDLVGAVFNVVVCCDAAAGTLTAEAVDCFDGSPVTLFATPNGDAVVPAGFEVVYVLTEGAGLVIAASGADPEFVVSANGSYTIHTLVYDPATLDLGVIQVGVTTGFDVNALLIQGGGSICASLDVNGAAYDVEICCDAEAGTLGGGGEVCYEGVPVTLTATANGDEVVPTGFSVVYVLTQGPGLVIIDAGANPEFDVDALGDHTIHTLVYDSTTLDLGIIDLGVTTGFDVNALLVQGGGSICASLDVAGAAFNVVLCCDAEAGTITADANEVCLLNDEAFISATPDGNSVVPTGFVTAYVLTEGPDLLIVALSATPDFLVTTTGDYTIHTIVYDTLTLDVSIIEFGQTTGFEVDSLLIQGGGTICASLDVAGAMITVQGCNPVNDDCANATVLSVQLPANCPANATFGDNTYAIQDAVGPSCDPTTIVYYADVWYTFNSGSNTEVTINFNSLTMSDWVIAVYDACNGNELECEILPDLPIVLTTTENTDYTIRVHSNLEYGDPGEFNICLTGAFSTVDCEGGDVETEDGFTSITVCQDAVADVIGFETTSTSAENYAYVLTDENDMIVTLLSGNSLDFNSAALGTYHVWGISYNGILSGVVPDSLVSQITASGECLELSSNFVIVSVEFCTGMDGMLANGWSIFPNPGDGDFNVSYAGADGDVVLEVIDMGGRLVHTERLVMTRGERYRVALAGRVMPGMYMVQLSSAGERTSVRLIVQ